MKNKSVDAEVEREMKKWIESAKKGRSYNKFIEDAAEFKNPELVQVFFKGYAS